MPSFSWIEQRGLCCGVVEIGGFTSGNNTWANHVSAETDKELWEAVFARMITRASKRSGHQRRGAFIHIWFKKTRGQTKYQYDGLMKLFKQCPKAWDLGAYTNPNTQNRIQGYGMKIHGR